MWCHATFLQKQKNGCQNLYVSHKLTIPWNCEIAILIMVISRVDFGLGIMFKLLFWPFFIYRLPTFDGASFSMSKRHIFAFYRFWFLIFDLQVYYQTCIIFSRKSMSIEVIQEPAKIITKYFPILQQWYWKKNVNKSIKSQKISQKFQTTLNAVKKWNYTFPINCKLYSFANSKNWL